MPHDQKSKTILIDVDGVLADFSAAYTRTAKGIDPQQEIISAVAQPDWNLRCFMDKGLVDATWDAVRQAEAWWTELHPLFTEKELYRLRHIMAAHEVVFCTGRKSKTRNPDGPTVAEQTIQWLEAKGIKHPSVLCCSKKGVIAKAIGATHSIEDKPTNVIDIHETTQGACLSYVMDRPYNRGQAYPSGVRRVFSLGEFLDEIEGQARLDKGASRLKLDVPGEIRNAA